MRTKWTAKEEKKLARLAKLGFTDKESAIRLGRTESSVTSKRHSLRVAVEHYKCGIIERLFVR